MNSLNSSPRDSLKADLQTIAVTFVFSICVVLSVEAITISLRNADKIKKAVAATSQCEIDRTQVSDPGLLAGTSSDKVIVLKLSTSLTKPNR